MDSPDTASLDASPAATPAPSRALAIALSSAAFVVPLWLSRSTSPSPDHPRVFLWYRLLRQPKFKPPDIAIPIAWVAIESALAVASYRLLRRPSSAARSRSLAWLAGNVVGIGAWSRLFFGSREPAGQHARRGRADCHGNRLRRRGEEGRPHRGRGRRSLRGVGRLRDRAHRGDLAQEPLSAAPGGRVSQCPPQTSSATSTISLSLARCASTAMSLPCTVLEKPHCGERQS